MRVGMYYSNSRVDVEELPVPKVHPAHEPAPPSPTPPVAPGAVFEEDTLRVALLAEAMKRHGGNGHAPEEDDDET